MNPEDMNLIDPAGSFMPYNDYPKPKYKISDYVKPGSSVVPEWWPPVPSFELKELPGSEAIEAIQKAMQAHRKAEEAARKSLLEKARLAKCVVSPWTVLQQELSRFLGKWPDVLRLVSVGEPSPSSFVNVNVPFNFSRSACIKCVFDAISTMLANDFNAMVGYVQDPGIILVDGGADENLRAVPFAVELRAKLTAMPAVIRSFILIRANYDSAAEVYGNRAKSMKFSNSLIVHVCTKEDINLRSIFRCAGFLTPDHIETVWMHSTVDQTNPEHSSWKKLDIPSSGTRRVRL